MLIITLVSIIYLFNNSILASESVILKKEKGIYLLGSNIEYLEDKEKKYSIYDVSAKNSELDFQQLKENSKNFGYTNSAYWFHIKIFNQDSKRFDGFLKQESWFINNLKLFIKTGANTWETKEIGSLFPFNQRIIAHRSLIFPFNIESKVEIEMYLRLKRNIY